MPKVKAGETRKQYVDRAIPYIIENEGLKGKQAAGKAHGLYDQYLRDLATLPGLRTHGNDIQDARVSQGNQRARQKGKK